MELVAKSNAQNINKVQKEITDIIKNKILEIVRNKEMKDILKVAISDVINKPDN